MDKNGQIRKLTSLPGWPKLEDKARATTGSVLPTTIILPKEQATEISRQHKTFAINFFLKTIITLFHLDFFARVKS